MDVEQLRWFLEVADRGHVTAAAAELHVSQPALSRSLASLQRQLGTALFDRRGRSLQLNRQGLVFAEGARRALAELDGARRAMEEIADPERGTVSLAFLHTLGTWLVPALLSAYRERRPGVRFQLAQDSAGPMLEMLLEGSADLIVTSPRPEDPRIAWSALMSEPLRLALPGDHPLAGRRRLRLAAVADESFVAMKPGYGLRAAADELCARAGITPRIAFEGEEAATLRGLVAAGLGLAIVPASVPAEGGPEHGSVLVPIGDPGATRQLGLAWVAERAGTPAVAEFRAFALAETRRLAGGGHRMLMSGSR